MTSDKMIETSDALIDLLVEKIGDLDKLENMLAALALIEIVKHSIIASSMSR